MSSSFRIGGSGNNLALGLIATLAIGCGPPASLPVWGQLPDFSLADQRGDAFGSSDLRGEVWIADFVFTSCPSRCPLLTREMARIQREIQTRGWDDVRLVSISVDPQTDTVQALSEYAARHRADPTIWRFLTGPREDIWSLSVDGFKLGVAEAAEANLSGPILHSDKFVLADRRGRIRGYYDALEDEQWTRLVGDVDAIRREPRAID